MRFSAFAIPPRVRGGFVHVMKVVLAEDEPGSRRVLERSLRAWGYTPDVYDDGAEVWEAIQALRAPGLVILDWMMPRLNGVDVCRRIRGMSPPSIAYIIMLTAKNGAEDLLEGFQAGADDYVQKPFSLEELRARIRVGERILSLQQRLNRRVEELEAALSKVDQLEQLLPICSYCKKIRVDHDYWEQLERYFCERSNVRFSHGICPACFQEQIEESA